MRRIVVLLVAVAACGKKQPAQATGGGSAGSAAAGSAVAVAPMATAAGSGLAYDDIAKGSDDEPPDAMPAIFGAKVPRTPAVSADGTLYATIEPVFYGGMPEPPMPIDLVVQKVGGDVEAERVHLFEDGEKITPKLAERGGLALKKLVGYHSLTMTEINWSDPKPVTFGDATLVSYEGDADLVVELHDAKGRVLHRETVDAYGTGSNDMDMCGYSPKLFAAGTDGPMLYVTVGFHYRDDCMPPKTFIFGWSLDPAKASPQDVAAGVIAHQLEQPLPPDAVATNGDVSAKAKGAVLDDVQVMISKDGTAAWGSGSTPEVRASDVLIKTPAGWQIVGAAWTLAVDNGKANADAKAGKLKPRALGGPGDEALADAFKKLTTDGVDAAAAANKDLIAIGSGPGERTAGGAAFARAWNAAWKGKLSIDSLAARTTPSGKTGWVTASVQLQKSGYKIPFLIFAVFDKTDAGWSLVHIHFAV